MKNRANIDSFLSHPESFEKKRVILLKVLLFICSNLKDTNILGKKDYFLLNEYQKICTEAIKKRSITSFFIQIEKINKYCIENDISSGGSADLFSSTLALIKIFNLF